MQKYGTYLVFLVAEILKKIPEPISVRDLAGMVETTNSQRERSNLENRVRRALAYLDGQGMLEKSTRQTRSNIFQTEYKIKSDEQTQTAG